MKKTEYLLAFIKAINSQLKNGIAKSVEEELEKAMFAYGHETAQTLIVDIEPDRKVKRATNEINDGKHWPTLVKLKIWT